eukprot:SAG31_NODE_2123_length_6401_cov_4.982069_5_plen_149_part_00
MEFTKFADHYSQLQENGTEATWICKPTDMSRGRRIFLLNDISELSYDRPCVVQRYIPTPLLIGGYKHDLRVYVAVTSVHPLRAFIYEEGLCRFSTTKFDLGNIQVSVVYVSSLIYECDLCQSIWTAACSSEMHDAAGCVLSSDELLGE